MKLMQRKPTAAYAAAELATTVLKQVFEVKEAERLERAAAADQRERREKLAALIVEKQNEGLKGLSLEELQKQLAALE